MRALFAILQIALLAAPLFAADPPKHWPVKVGQTIEVQVDTGGDDVTKIVVDKPELVDVTAKTVGDKKHVVLSITGKAVGSVEVLADAVLYYSVLVDVAAADPAPVPVPGDVPVVPLKRIPVEPKAVTPPAAKPAIAPKKISAPIEPISFRTPALAVDPSASEVKVVVDFGRKQNNGSGTVVRSRPGQSLVLTNHHVVPAAAGRISVENGGYSYPAAWVASDADADLAILLIGYELPAVSMADELPARGAELRQWGHPAGGPVKPKRGQSLGLDAPTDPRSSLTASYEGELGESGCGVFNTDGKLVAVLNSYETRTHRASCIPLARVKEFVSKHDRAYPSCTGCTDCQCAPGDCKKGKCPAKGQPSNAPQAKAQAAPLECTT